MNFVISILLSLVLYSCFKSLDKRKTENSRARAAYRASWSVIIFIIAKGEVGGGGWGGGDWLGQRPCRDEILERDWSESVATSTTERSILTCRFVAELYEVFFEGSGIGSVSDVIAGFLGTWLASETMVEGAQTQQEKKDRRWAKKEI